MLSIYGVILATQGNVLSEIRKILELSDDISLKEYILNFISQS